MRAQNAIHASLSADLNAFATSRDWLALLAVLPVGALFGSIHALTPGHGKSVLASYLVGSGLRTARAAGVAILLAAMHIGSAVVLALIAAPLVTRTFVGGGRAPSLEIATRLLLIGIGVWLVARSLWRRPHVHGEGVAVSLAAGLVPCPRTLFVMFFALSRGVLEDSPSPRRCWSASARPSSAWRWRRSSPGINSSRCLPGMAHRWIGSRAASMRSPASRSSSWLGWNCSEFAKTLQRDIAEPEQMSKPLIQ